jgi:hypothetical protein
LMTPASRRDIRACPAAFPFLTVSQPGTAPRAVRFETTLLPARHSIAWMGFRLPRAPGCTFWPPQKRIARPLAARVPSEACNEEVIDYFGGVRRAPRRRPMRSYGRDDHRLHGGQSWPIDYRLGFFSSTTEATRMAAYRQSLGRRDGMRARMPHGRAETAVHGVVARRTANGPQEMTVRARHGVVADLASKRTLISSHHI